MPEPLPPSSRAFPAASSGVYRLFGKRLFDLCASALGLLLLSPLFLLLAILIRLESTGPAFFRQVRVGRDARRFLLVKFRTMVRDAESLGSGLTAAGDARVTRLGRLLRQAKLDEFPQLWNVLRGDMSLVGPRPELPQFVHHYTSAQRHVLSVRPGITDPASLFYRDESALLAAQADPGRFYRDFILPHKLALSLEYIRGIAFARDLVLILRTLRAILSSPAPASSAQALASDRSFLSAKRDFVPPGPPLGG